MKTKKCTKCRKELPETEEFFHFRKDNNKFRNECKNCIKDIQKEYRDINSEKIKKRIKKKHQKYPWLRVLKISIKDVIIQIVKNMNGTERKESKTI